MTRNEDPFSDVESEVQYTSKIVLELLEQAGVKLEVWQRLALDTLRGEEEDE